ncbi:MAG: DUF1573 domain-containing protein [Planctomycetales bacterium]|nr:DUF1573 domain-containing protein [Planctomycetales bacterium]
MTIAVSGLLFVTSWLCIPNTESVLLTKTFHQELDLGSVDLGHRMVAELNIINDFDRPVIIREVKLSCSCVSGAIEKKELQSRESTTLRLELQTSRGGEKNAIVSVYGEDNVHLSTIPIKWTVLQNMIAEPAPISFGEVGGSSSQELEIKIWRVKDKKQLVPKGLRVSASPGQVLKVEVIEPNTVRILLADAASVRDSAGHLDVQDSETGQNIVTLPVHWRVKTPPVLVFPSVIRLKVDNIKPISINLIAKEEDLAQITTVESQLTIADWSVDQISKRSARLTVTFDGSDVISINSNSLALRISIRGEEGISIPVFLLGKPNTE